MERVSLKAYAVMNLAFWAFCVLQYFVIRMWLGRTPGLITGFAPLFIALGAGFTLVCVFDAISDLVSSQAEERGEEESEEKTATS
jgi:hypothetical protein